MEDLQHLRTQLQHTCEELRILSAADLLEGRWKIKKLIFSELIGNCPSLRDQNTDLLNLLDQEGNNNRQNFLANASKKVGRKSAHKELVTEEEIEFRTCFLRIVLAALTKLRWPPALEPFGDPIGSLFNDNAVVLDAYKYFLNVGFSTSAKLAPPKLSSATPHTERLENKIEVVPTMQNKSSSIKSNSLLSELDSLMEDNSSSHSKPTPLTQRSDMNISDNSYCPPSSQQVTVQAFEKLQYHNELLSNQLSSLLEQLSKRDQAEAQLTAIITDLKTAVDEIVSIGNPSSTNIVMDNSKRSTSSASSSSDTYDKSAAVAKEKRRSSIQPLAAFIAADKDQHIDSTSGMVTEDERKSYLKEILREESSGDVALAAKVPLPPEKSMKAPAAKPPIQPSFSRPHDGDSPSSLGMWYRLQKRLNVIQSQWMEAKKEAKMFVSRANAKNHFSSPPHGDPRKSVAGSGHSTRRGAASYSPYHIASSPTKDQDKEDAFSILSKPVDQLTKQMLGLHAAASIPSSCEESGIDPNIGLDLPRIHLLQRDLINLSNALFDCSKEFKLERFPCSQEEGDRAAATSALQSRCCELLLHLACMAPVAALSLPDDSPLNASVTAVTALEKAINASNGNKAMPLQLQRLLDRAKAEQVSLVRCILSKDRLIEQWCAGAKVSAAQIQSLNHSYKKIIDAASREINACKQAFEALCSALKDAEAARVPNDSGKASTSSMVSPFDSLSRGSAGNTMHTYTHLSSIHTITCSPVVIRNLHSPQS